MASDWLSFDRSLVELYDETRVFDRGCCDAALALGYLRARAYSFTTVAPDEVHLRAIERLEAELRQRYGSLDVEVDVANQVYLVLVTRG